MTIEEQNRMYINLLARSMGEFPLWASRCHEARQSANVEDISQTDKGAELTPLSDKQPDTSY